VVSHVFAGHGALYAHPLYVGTWARRRSTGGRDWTASVGLGARWRLGGSHVYVVAEAAPKSPARPTASITSVSLNGARAAIYSIHGGQCARHDLSQVVNGANRGDWYVGFNLSRKFY
jgi:hypothetical protein